MDIASTGIYTLSLHDALPISHPPAGAAGELARRGRRAADDRGDLVERHVEHVVQDEREPLGRAERVEDDQQRQADRKSTRLNSSHTVISYAVFCLKKKKRRNI